MPDDASTLTVPALFCGPPTSGNGGWTSGALAAVLDPSGEAPVRVRLRRPPPLDVPLGLVADGAGLSARHGEDVVAEAVRADVAPETVEAVPADVARAAEARYAGLTSHPFPTCYVCGTGRAPGDGMRIFPGRVDDDTEGRVRVAATWTPEQDADPATAWAALDCVGGWAGDLGERLMVLGTITAQVRELPRAGVEHVVVGGARGAEGRRTSTASTLWAEGRPIATAEHVWVAVAPEAVR
ncbi:hypothetical protein [Nocardioides marinquilinus]|uniref:hypothetical protein n=1 Tax=Nocardioides marinquilinus TaxID=1210400 RepID=UPI0031E67576